MVGKRKADVLPAPLSSGQSVTSQTSAAVKPKKKIFSSERESTRAVVFNVKNFWTSNSNYVKVQKVQASAKSKSLDVGRKSLKQQTPINQVVASKIKQIDEKPTMPLKTRSAQSRECKKVQSSQNSRVKKEEGVNKVEEKPVTRTYSSSKANKGSTDVKFVEIQNQTNSQTNREPSEKNEPPNEEMDSSVVNSPAKTYSKSAEVKPLSEFKQKMIEYKRRFEEQRLKDEFETTQTSEINRTTSDQFSKDTTEDNTCSQSKKVPTTKSIDLDETELYYNRDQTLLESELPEDTKKQSGTSEEPNKMKNDSEIKNDELPKPPIKAKKKIFSSSSRKNHAAVFDVKNFWKNDATEDLNETLAVNAPNGANTASSSATSSQSDKKNEFDFEDDSNYVKLHRVKKAHQCHELGESEQFDGDIKFYLDGISGNNTVSMRCLSIVGLSQQCMRPEFRMHLRAHDDMPRIISALIDAPKDANLAICTATLMFVYSQDRLTMDIDPNALSLMLQLLETRSDEYDNVDKRHREKVKDLCKAMKEKGFAKYLNLEEITAGKLAMETLLGLTSKRAGDWFKEELRRLKGIDFILNTIIRCSEMKNDEGQMNKIDRCMHVLENVTFMNTENQDYIIRFEDGLLIETCIDLLESNKIQIIALNDAKVYLSAFISILRVFTHLTSEINGSTVIASAHNGFFDLLLECLFEVPSFVLPEQRFDLMLLLLSLCINFVEFCPSVRTRLMDNTSGLTGLIEILLNRIKEAQQTEQDADDLLESQQIQQLSEDMQDSLLNQVIAKSGKHMEHSIIAACISLLLGCTIQDNKEYTETIRDHLPDLSFEPLVDVLQKLHEFAHLADIMTESGTKRVKRILNILKSS